MPGAMLSLLSFLAGPAGGFLGAIFQKGMTIFEANLAHKQRMEELEVLSRIDLQKADIVYRQAVSEGQDASFKAAIDAQASSQAGDNWAKDIVALFRPGLTLILYGLAIYFAWQVTDGDSMKDYAVRFITLAEIATGYWFGVRTFDKVPTIQPAFPQISSKK